MRRTVLYVIPVALAGGCDQPGQPTTQPMPTSIPRQIEQTEYEGLPPIDSLANTWNTIRPGADTTCLYGTSYGFFVKPENLDRVLITFPGGGTCWSGLTCSDEPRGRVNDNPKTVRAEDNPVGSAGIFAEDNPENPFRDFTKVHVGYCTGDMHIGNAVRLNDGWVGDGIKPSDTLYFNGHKNAMTVLQWVFANVPSPETVVIGGHTSGSYGTPLYASIVADHYPDAAIRHLGDGNGALHIGERLRPLVDAWNTAGVLAEYPGFDHLRREGLTFDDITVAAARRHPEIVFTQMITAHDNVFTGLLEYLGIEESVLEVVEAGHRYVKEQVPNYRTYVADGNRHVISLGYFDAVAPSGNRNRGLPNIYDRFYSYQVEGRRYRDWVADMVAGEPIEDVRCRDCEEVEYYDAQ